MDSFEILIVEDELIIAATLEEMLRQLGYKHIKRCKTQSKASRILTTERIDLAILDINLDGGQEGLELGGMCHEKGIPYFFLTSYSDRKTLLDAKDKKPGSYVIKPFSPEEIMVAVEMTLMHSQPEMVDKLNKAKEVFELSAREVEIVELMAMRLSNQEIGEKLFLSLNTVKYHIRHIYAKMDASTKQQVIERIDSTWMQKS